MSTRTRISREREERRKIVVIQSAPIPIEGVPYVVRRLDIRGFYVRYQQRVATDLELYILKMYRFSSY
jgi:hypothetical protein